jgi:hypothetical protein
LHIPDLVEKLYVFHIFYRKFFPHGGQNGNNSMHEHWKSHRIEKFYLHINKAITFSAWLYNSCRGHRMVVGFKTTYAISAYHH